MRTVPALAVTLLALLALVAPEANSVRADRVHTSLSTEQASVEAPQQEPAPTAERPARINVSARPTVTVRGGSEAQRASLDEALARFRDHGLELPDVDVRFSHDQADCGGNLGIFENSFTPWRLSICTEAAFVPTHELAHAWEAANLDDDARERYLAARGLTNWNDREADWADRGVEDSARIMQQNLMAANPILTMSVWTERLDAYELLVGRPSPLRSDPGDAAGSQHDRVDDAELTTSLTSAEQALVEWAIDRFAQAGLELPELTVRFDPSRAPCNNAEFGHAWDVANMTAEDRQEMSRFLGVESWDDHDDPWADRGIERFVETFVFALLDQPRRQLKVDLECIDLLRTFRAATEAEPLGPGLPPCVDGDAVWTPPLTPSTPLRAR